MKQKIKTSASIFITLISLVGCTHSTSVTPSQNNSLNAVSPTNNKKESYFMQKSLDSWLKTAWTPTVEKDAKVQQKYMKPVDSKKYEEDKQRGFTLQEYVDKAGAYMEARPNDYNTSHAHKMESMPVIGK